MPKANTTGGDSGKRVHNDMETFLRAVETSETKVEAANKLGITIESLTQRASAYRSKGIPVKKFPRSGGARLDIAAANEFLAKLRQEN